MLKVKFSLFWMLTVNVRLVGKLYYIVLIFRKTFLKLLYVMLYTVLILIVISIGWLEPLLEAVSKNATRIVSPVIDIINDDTFSYTR